MKGAPVRVAELTKRYGDHVAVDSLSFEVRSGVVTGFLGPNGSGKTTTFRMLLGLAAPTAGTAELLGGRYQDLRDPLRRVGALLDCSGFHPGRSARSHLRAVAAAGGINPGRAEELIELVGLSGAAERRVGEYSTGMRRRLGLATALLGDPELLILDEPANGLDPAGVRWLRDLLRQFADQGRTVVVSSHVLAEVSQIVDDVVIIGRGRLVARGSLNELTTTASTVIARTPQPSELIDALGGFDANVVESAGRLLVTGVDAAAVGEAAAGRGLVLHELRQEHATLEDTFLALTAEATR